VTDRRTDILPHGIVRAMHMRRVVKTDHVINAVKDINLLTALA